MDRIAAFFKRFGRRNVRAWAGPRPRIYGQPAPRAIAAMVGYPTSTEAWTDAHDLISIDRPTAAKVLAFVATTSLAYGRFGPPKESYRRLAAAALDDLGPDAVFLSNTTGWVTGPPIEIRPKRMSTATFEAGLIAYDTDNALIFWVEEED